MEKLKRINRRDFFKLAGLGAATVVVEATTGGIGDCLGHSGGQQEAGLPRPEPTATAAPEATVAPEILPAWPGTPEKAAALFGGSSERWEVNPDGGWHLREEGWTTLIDPHGYVIEGYRDTEPGKNPLCMASAGVGIEIQGGTVWPERGTKEAARELQEKMAIPIWDDGSQHPCQVILPK